MTLQIRSTLLFEYFFENMSLTRTENSVEVRACTCIKASRDNTHSETRCVKESLFHPVCLINRLKFSWYIINPHNVCVGISFKRNSDLYHNEIKVKFKLVLNHIDVL